MGPSDTPPAIEAIQLDLLRQAGTARRAALALNLSRAAIRAIDEIRPEISTAGEAASASQVAGRGCCFNAARLH